MNIQESKFIPRSLGPKSRLFSPHLIESTATLTDPQWPTHCYLESWTFHLSWKVTDFLAAKPNTLLLHFPSWAPAGANPAYCPFLPESHFLDSGHCFIHLPSQSSGTLHLGSFPSILLCSCISFTLSRLLLLFYTPLVIPTSRSWSELSPYITFSP